ncbi:MAG: cellulase family glycosylhydrolase [Saprospiraceae bacterium]|nr:cellulase family glycosylhydrolase [Saprospiraceae bacterium]
MRLLVFWVSNLTLIIAFGQAKIVRDKIFINNERFTPIVLNYGVSIRHEGTNSYFVSPSMTYCTYPKDSNCKDASECYENLKRDFTLISSLGYNTIRVFDFAYGFIQRGDKIEGPATLDISYYYGPLKLQYFKEPFEDHFQLLDKIVIAAREAGLKIILLSGGKGVHLFPTSEDYNIYLQFLARRYSEDTTIIAYDLANEPSYFHTIKDKREVKAIIKQWCASIRNNTNNQLITIGLTDANTTFDWDPELLNVDFLSFHLYPEDDGSLEAYMKQLKWISTTIQKPWMIGETGFASSQFGKHKLKNGSEKEQAEFFKTTLKACRDCGSLGYSWWQYHDVNWSPDYGIMDSLHNLKLVANESRNCKSYVPVSSQCQILETRVAKTRSFKKSYSAVIVDRDNSPIANAVVRASLSRGKFIFEHTDAQGRFEFKSDKKIKILRVTAPGYNTRRVKTFFAGEKITLKRIKDELKYEKSFIEKNRIKYCELLIEREKDECIINCINDPSCIKECKDIAKQKEKRCSDKLLPARI